MKKYRLKQWYPSLKKTVEVGCIITKIYTCGGYHYRGSDNEGVIFYVSGSQCENNPDFWELIEENKPKPLFITEDVAEFKAGDILVDDLGIGSNGTISIFKCISEKDDNLFDIYAFLDAEYNDIINIINIGESEDAWDFIEDQRLATEEEKQLLFDALKKEGKRWNAETLELEKLDISEIVVDYESAIKYLGIKDTLLVFKSYDRVDKFNAQIKLQLIAEAWNKFDEFEADWENSDQCKHCPMFMVEDGKIEFLYTIYSRVILDSQTSNFSFKTEERARQFGNQFIDLFKVALGF